MLHGLWGCTLTFIVFSRSSQFLHFVIRIVHACYLIFFNVETKRQQTRSGTGWMVQHLPTRKFHQQHYDACCALTPGICCCCTNSNRPGAWHSIEDSIPCRLSVWPRCGICSLRFFVQAVMVSNFCLLSCYCQNLYDYVIACFISKKWKELNYLHKFSRTMTSWTWLYFRISNVHVLSFLHGYPR